jgi:LSD1 subclass zinc finger protein
MSAIHLPELVLFCSGCKRPFEAPRSAGTKQVECSHCGHPMHIVTIAPADEAGEARGGQ